MLNTLHLTVSGVQKLSNIGFRLHHKCRVEGKFGSKSFRGRGGALGPLTGGVPSGVIPKFLGGVTFMGHLWGGGALGIKLASKGHPHVESPQAIKSTIKHTKNKEHYVTLIVFPTFIYEES